MGRRSVPVRTCVGCRERAANRELLRVVAVEGAVVPDPSGRLPGRGAYLHPDPRCLALAERRRAFGRALRTTAAPDTGPLRSHLEQQRGTDNRTESDNGSGSTAMSAR